MGPLGGRIHSRAAPLQGQGSCGVCPQFPNEAASRWELRAQSQAMGSHRRCLQRRRGQAPAASATSPVPGTGAAGGREPKQAPGKPNPSKSQQPEQRKWCSEHGTCGDVLLGALLWALKGALREDLQCLSNRPERSFQLSSVVAFGG